MWTSRPAPRRRRRGGAGTHVRASGAGRDGGPATPGRCPRRRAAGAVPDETVALALPCGAARGSAHLGSARGRPHDGEQPSRSKVGGVAVYLGSGQEPGGAWAAGPDVLGELCGELFESLARSDQRRKGIDYVRGLLTATGRKTIRNIAAVLPGRAAEQALHHFICSSTWDWTPVRRSLARYLARVAAPKAWVVRPIVIPKTGRHSVGVDRRSFPNSGRCATPSSPSVSGRRRTS